MRFFNLVILVTIWMAVALINLTKAGKCANLASPTLLAALPTNAISF